MGSRRDPWLRHHDGASCAFHLADVWRNPVMLFADYYIAHTYQSVSIEPIDFGPVPAKDWALDGSSSGSGRAKLVSPLGDTKQRDDQSNTASHSAASLSPSGGMLCPSRRSTSAAHSTTLEPGP